MDGRENGIPYWIPLSSLLAPFWLTPESEASLWVKSRDCLQTQARQDSATSGDVLAPVAFV